MNPQRRNVLIRAAVLCAAAAALLLVGFYLVDRWQSEKYREVRGSGTEEFMRAGSVEWQGEWYKQTPAVTTILVAGIDTELNAQQGVGTSRYRNGGQADFLLLLAVDHTNRRIHQLQIDRDAMTDVTILSVYGRETGTREMQICLSHSYGANKEENARYTVKAVRGLLEDLEIEAYYMLDYSAIGTLTDALGGVRVTVPDDMTSVNAQWEKGKEVTLTGSEAETFVRTRKTVGGGTNEERMRRQSEYMGSAVAALKARLARDPGFAAELLSSLAKSSATNLSDQKLAEEIQDSAGYEVLPVEYLPGEYRIGESGYMEFYVEEGGAKEWIMRSLYTKEQ